MPEANPRTDPRRPPIAVVGVSALFPGSPDETGFWRDILAGRDLLGPVPPTHWLVEDYYHPDPAAPDRVYSRRGGFLDPVDFDPLAWGIPPSIVPATDTSQLLALILAQRVLEDATRGQFASVDRSRVSVILGVTSAQELLSTMVGRLQRPMWVKALREAGLPEAEVESICDRISANYVGWQEATFPGLLGNVVAGRIANRLDLGGTNCITDAACASSFSALQMGVNELYLGQSDLVITGGVDTMNDIFMYMCFCKTPALSPTDDCRPFSDQADGTMLGEGLGMVALKRLEDAEAAGDRIYAVVRGVGSSSDGRAKSVYAPLPEGQARALRRAYQEAGYGPDTVELEEAHGTATKAGDVAEVEALTAVFDESGRSDRQWCGLGSVKSQIGHTKATAGAAGLFKVVMALHSAVLAPTIKVERPNPKLELERSPFYLNTRSRPWVRGASHLRRGSVSSFGFGGSNFHVALEEYVGPGKRAERLRATSCELVVLGADTADSLRGQVERHRTAAATPGYLAWLSWSSLREQGTPPARRLALVATDGADLERKLGRAAEHLGRAPDEPLSTPDGVHYGCGQATGGLAFLFPGQGSQHLDMGADLALHFRSALATWDRAADLDLFAAAPLHRMVFPIPAFTAEERADQERRLTATEWAQPAIGGVSLSMLALLGELGLEPTSVGGHSFGEITALHAAGVLSAEALLRVARRRGELMAEATEPGAMTAVAARVDRVREAIARAGVEVVVANHNGPEQVVLSGATAAIEQVEARLAAEGLNARRLPVSTAFHSPIVSGASAPFAAFLATVAVASPRIPVYSNAEAAPYPTDPDAIRSLLAGSIARPVRFVEQVEAMAAAGARTFVEVGPGAVLTGLVRQILADHPHLAVNLDRKGKNGLESFLAGLATLWAAGVEMRLAALWQGYRIPADPAQRVRPRHAIAICGANYGKAYPPPGGVAALPPPNPPRPEARQETAQPVVPAPAAALPTVALAVVAADSGWVTAFQEAQRQTADAHVAYQRQMADAHQAFLRTAEAGLAGLAALLGASAQPASVPVSAPVVEPVPPPLPAPVSAPVAQTVPVPEGVVRERVADGGAGAGTGKTVDVGEVLLQVVAETTGYPADMLMLEMDLEGDLGVDSIKRVEILSALRDRIPGLPAVEPGEMGKLRTLHQIVDALATSAPPVPVAVPVPEGPVRERATGGGVGSGTGTGRTVDVGEVLLQVVAETTGYPADMLMLEMDLEGDLGVDSIKRVEILSALRDRIPGLPAVEPGEMGKLRTLHQIVDALATSALPVPVPVPVPENLVRERVAGGGPETGAGTEAIGRFALELADAPPLGMALPGLYLGQRTVVLDGGSEVGPALVEALARRSVRAELAERVPADATGVLFLGGLRPVATVEEALALEREAFRVARDAGQVLVDGGALLLAFDTGGDLGLSGSDPTRAWLGGLAGLAKSAAQEWPGVALKAVDLERAGRPAAAIAEALAAELLDGGPEVEVGLPADGRRLRLRSVPAAATAGELPLDERSVVVVSGGARGVTAACLLELARAARPRFLLLGRTPLGAEPPDLAGVADDDLRAALLAAARGRGETPTPAALAALERQVAAGREVRRTLRDLEAAGSAARYLAVDVRDRVAVAQALAEVRSEWGPIQGLLHAAGLIADKLLVDTTDDQLERVLSTKVEGLRALLEATAADPLRVLCLFSSVAGRCGNAGQAGYAMANEVLNKVADAERRRRGPSCLVKSIGWGPWAGGMVTPELAARFAERGVELIPLGVGARMLREELSGCRPEQVEVVVGARPQARPLLGGARPPLTLEVAVDRASHPWLADHAIRGTVVLPVALVAEWFARVAGAFEPDLELAALNDLRVLRGVRLERFATAGERFRVCCRSDAGQAPGTLLLELRGLDGALHYSALATMAAHREPPGTGAPDLELEPWNERPLYGGALFHGPELQVIEAIEGVSRQGIAGRLAGLAGRGWPAQPWRTDPAALDGLLQLALRWTEHVLGAASLPTRIGRVLIGADGPFGRARAVVVGRSAEGQRATCDAFLLDDGGRRVVELSGVETHLLPGD